MPTGVHLKIVAKSVIKDTMKLGADAFKMQPRPTIFAFASGIVVDPLIIVFRCSLLTISTCNLQE